MSPRGVELLVFGVFATVIVLGAYEFLLNRRLASGRCLCGKKTPCHDCERLCEGSACGCEVCKAKDRARLLAVAERVRDALDRLAAQHAMLSHLMFEVAGLRRLLEEKEVVK